MEKCISALAREHMAWQSAVREGHVALARFVQSFEPQSMDALRASLSQRTPVGHTRAVSQTSADYWMPPVRAPCDE